MLKKTIKTVSFVLILAASVASFIFMNSTSTQVEANASIEYLEAENANDDQVVNTPVLTVAKKAIIIARWFLYPSE